LIDWHRQYTIITLIRGEHRKLSIRGLLFYPKVLDRGKTTSRGLTPWSSPHMNAIAVLLYWNYSKMFRNLNVLLYRRLYIGRQLVCRPVTTYCLHLFYICLACSSGCHARQQNFRKTSKLSYYLYIVKYVMYNKRLLHDIFHIGPGISPRLPYQARQRSWRTDTRDDMENLMS
jgi:hypothetical protein